MKTYRKTAVLVGILFIIGTLSGIISGIVTAPLMTDSSFPLNLAVVETQWTIGTLLILLMGLPLAMIPVVLYPLFKKHNEVLAQGAVLFRGVLEAVCYIAMVVCMFVILSLSQSNLDLSNMQIIASLVNSANNWIGLTLAIVFTVGSLIISILFYQMRLIPRWLSGWGIIGSILYFVAPFISMLSPQHPSFGFESILGFLIGPLAIQEMVFALWAIIKGFKQPVLKESV